LDDEQIFRSDIVEMGDLVDAGHNLLNYWVGIDDRGFIFA
jgi:hypothetical protein